MIMMKKERESRESVIVVLDGIKASSGKRGLAPLKYALREVVGPGDEVLVILTIRNSEAEAEAEAEAKAKAEGFDAGCSCVGDEGFKKYSCEGDSYVKFLREEMCQRKEAFAHIFRPYYDICKSREVKFRVKIVAIFEPKALLVEEANNVYATWIVMDRCFVRNQSCQMSETHCNVTLVSDDGEIVTHKTLPQKDGAETSCSNPDEELISPYESHVHHKSPNFETKYQPYLPYHASTSRENENQTMPESSSESKSLRNAELLPNAQNPITEKRTVDHNTSSPGFSEVNLVVRMPLQLSWPVVKEITGGFTRMTCFDENESYKTYCGYLSDHHSQVLVKRFTGQLDYVLKAEKKAALSMYHKNILGLTGYHMSKNGTVLVYPFTRRWTLDRFLHGSKGKQRIKSTFQEKIKIATGIGEGIRYMHEECPRGPVVHGDLRPCNIFLSFDFEPQITSFGKATWLQQKHGLPISCNRFWHTDRSELESLALLKSDIIRFGILLLRLFCRRSAPRDDNFFVEWARPLLQQRAYPELLDEDMKDLDVYGIFRVMCVAYQCINTKPLSRLSMSEVISLLKGETSFAMQLSPSSEDSPRIDISGSTGRAFCNLTYGLSLSE